MLACVLLKIQNYEYAKNKLNMENTRCFPSESLYVYISFHFRLPETISNHRHFLVQHSGLTYISVEIARMLAWIIVDIMWSMQVGNNGNSKKLLIRQQFEEHRMEHIEMEARTVLTSKGSFFPVRIFAHRFYFFASVFFFFHFIVPMIIFQTKVCE